MSDVSLFNTGQVPFSQEAEEATIGSVLVNPDCFAAVRAIVEPGDFFILRNRYVWDAIDRLAERNETIEILSIKSELLAMQRLSEVGGFGYLTQLINNTPTSVHAEVYAELVARAATRRKLMNVADKIKALALDESRALDAVLNEATRQMYDIAGATGRNALTPFGDAVIAYFKRAEYLMDHPGEVIGLATGFTELDKMLEGLKPGELTILAGRPGMGKSALLLSIVLNILAQGAGRRVLLFSQEMGVDEITQRAVSNVTNINLQTIRRSTMSQAQWRKFVEDAGRIHSYQLFIDDRADLTPNQMRAQIRRLTMGGGRLDLVVDDYLQLMRVPGFRPSERVQELGYISGSLKRMAKEFRVPVLCAAQLSRAVEQRADKRPQLSDLRESGSIENDADVVGFIYRDDYYNEQSEHPNTAEIIIAKHRNGPTGMVHLYFEKKLTKYMNAAERTIDLGEVS